MDYLIHRVERVAICFGGMKWAKNIVYPNILLKIIVKFFI